MTGEDEHDLTAPKIGDYVWLTPASPSNALERMVAELLKDKYDGNTIVRLMISPLGPEAVSTAFGGNHTVRLGNSYLALLRVDGELQVEIPRTHLSRTGLDRTISHIRSFTETVSLRDQYLLIVAKEATDLGLIGDDKVDDLDFEAGIAALLLGQELARKSIFDNFFHLREAKFSTRDMKLVKSSTREKPVVLFDDLPSDPFGKFSEKEIRALKFCYRAHKTNDENMRLILYYSALEILFDGDRKFGNKLRKFYSFSNELTAASDKIINELRTKRKEAIHRGLHREFTGESERLVQAVILDCVFASSWGTHETSMLRHVLQIG
ncbi:MAG: hypothetical protein AAGL96_06505 [Pseudomonadota bacterium]